MANIFLLCALSTFLFPQFEAHIYLPVSRAPDSSQFVATVHLGVPPVPTRLVLDLSAPFLFADQSVSGVPLNKCSIQCFKSKAHVDDPEGSSTCFDRNRGIASQGVCRVSSVSSFTGLEARGELVEDRLEIRSDSESSVEIESFIFAIGPSLLLSGIASGADGVLGLGRSNIGVVTQISNAVSSQRKFSLCLSSTTGFLLFGDPDANPLSPSKISNDLSYTPLINREGDYLIEVKSIRINSQKVPNALGGAKISTAVPYTVLSSAIYEAFTKAYESAAIAMNMTRVESSFPFSVCFSSEGVKEGPNGYVVPSVDLVLQSEMVKWRIGGRNLMTPVGDKTCLGFVDGGAEMDVGMVIGGLQLVDNLLEFNVGTNMLGLGKQSCSGSVPDLIGDS